MTNNNDMNQAPNQPMRPRVQVQPQAPVQPRTGTPNVALGQPEGQDPKKNGRKRTILVVLLVLIVALIIWLLIWLFACNGNNPFDTNAQSGQAPYKTEEEMRAELDRKVEEGMFNISIASVIEFEDGTSNGTAYIENVPGNRYNMQVTITEDETGDVLYESGVLQPNQDIENITLTRDLDPGSYEATAMFTALDPDTFQETGQAAAKVNLEVLG